MLQYVPLILASGLLAFLVTPLTRILARRLGMIDQPGLRKAHRSPIPLLGGLAIFTAFLLSFLFFSFDEWLNEGLGIVGGATLLFLTGLWDDRFGLPARIKLAAQFLAAGMLIATGVQVRLFDLWWLDWPITLVWVVGITNAVNLMDNMDGLAAGVSAVGAVSFFVLAALEGQGLVASLAALLFGSAAGFLFYNFAPAVSFMGDAGALTLGFLLAVLGIKIEFKSLALASTWMAPIVVLGVLIFDTTLVSISRTRRGRSIFQGGSDHTSHRLVQAGFSPPRAVLTLYVVAGALGLLALWFTRQPALTANIGFGALVGAGLIALFVFERIEPKLTGDPALVLIPGGGGFAEALRAAQAVSRNVTVVFAPRQINGMIEPTRAEVIETIVALAEDPTATRALLRRGLSEEWWRELNALNHALRLNGAVAAGLERPAENLPSANPTFTLTGEPHPALLATLRKAKLILLGPGNPEINLIPTLVAPGAREALAEARERCILVEAGAAGAWLGGSSAETSLTALPREMQIRLLGQAAGQGKTHTA
jgi:UDP-GlcNAc:undecaprenyl-phosphate GlcNAc-1-phosphate transferase